MKNLFLALSMIFMTLNFSCGVKGKPQPPLKPAIISRGEPSFSKATEKLKVPANKNKKKIEGDFDEPYDFENENEEKK